MMEGGEEKLSTGVSQLLPCCPQETFGSQEGAMSARVPLALLQCQPGTIHRPPETRGSTWVETTRGWIGGHPAVETTAVELAGSRWLSALPSPGGQKGDASAGKNKMAAAERQACKMKRLVRPQGQRKVGKAEQGAVGRRCQHEVERKGRRELWRRKRCGASSQGRTRGVGEREGDADRRYLFGSASPVAAHAALQACLCAAFF